MTKYIRRLGTPLALGAVLAVSACTVKDNKSDTTLAADSALNRDLQLANQDTSLQPQLRAVPATPPAPAPAAVTPRASTPASRPASRPTTTTTRTTTTKPAPTTTASGNTVTRNPAGS